MLRQAVLKLTEGRGARDADGRAWVRVPKALRALFADADRVPAAEFEADLRVLMHRVRHERREHAAYAKLFEDAAARLREGAARGEQSPSSRAEIEAEVKRAFKREWLEVEEELLRSEGSFHFPDY